MPLIALKYFSSLPIYKNTKQSRMTSRRRCRGHGWAGPRREMTSVPILAFWVYIPICKDNLIALHTWFSPLFWPQPPPAPILAGTRGVSAVSRFQA